MTSHRIDRTINSIIGKAESVGQKLPGARTELLRRLNAIDGYGTESDAPKVKATSELTGVERAAAQRIGIYKDLAGLNEELDAALRVLVNLDAWCDRIIGTRIDGPGRCSSTGREGAIEWCDPNCWDAPVAGRTGLCARCYQRERRWRIAHGMPTREVA